MCDWLGFLGFFLYNTKAGCSNIMTKALIIMEMTITKKKIPDSKCIKKKKGKNPHTHTPHTKNLNEMQPIPLKRFQQNFFKTQSRDSTIVIN